MPPSTRVVWSPALLGYDFGPGHPMSPVRLATTFGLLDALGLLEGEDVEVVEAVPATLEELLAVHDRGYVEAVRAASDWAAAGSDPAAARDWTRHGLGTEDDPVFAGMHEAAARIAGGSALAAGSVWSGECLRAVSLAGGMHHALAGSASGFCVYNDVAVAIRRLLDDGARRVAYVDLDAHHGDGVEAAFWDDPRVLTVSVHQSGATLFPGTGFAGDVGGPQARGTAVNVALPPGTDGAGWLRALDAVALPAVRAFEPQVVVTQHGCDAHRLDVLTDLDVGIDAQRTAAAWMRRLADELADGRWVALGGGGYAVFEVVPLVWAHVVATAVGRPLSLATPVPSSWREDVERTYGVSAPERMGDPGDGDARDAGGGGSGADAGRAGDAGFHPWERGYDPDDDLDRAILATRAAVFPLLGLSSGDL